MESSRYDHNLYHYKFVLFIPGVKDINVLSDQIRQIAYAIHTYHGHGHLEKVYENALAHRLRKAGLVADQLFGC
jgi:PD-(D/E)XK nuclease superfamily